MINILPDNYTIGLECHFVNNTPVNPERWEAFLRYKETMKMSGKPFSFSREVIRTYFNDVVKMGSPEMVLRDAEFQFVSHLEREGFLLEFDVKKDAWLVQIKKP